MIDIPKYPPLMPKLPGSVRCAITNTVNRNGMSERQAKLYLCKQRWFCTLEQLESKLAEKPPCTKQYYNQPYKKKTEAQCECGVVEVLVTRLGKEVCRYCAAIINGQRPADPTEEEIKAQCEAIRKGWGKKRIATSTGTTIRQHVETQVCDFGVLSGRAGTKLA